MKKVLVLVLVLAMATAASASTVTIEGSTINPAGPLPGETVTVTITADVDVGSQYLLSLGSTTTSTAGDATATAGTLNAGFDLMTNAGTVRNGMTNWGAGSPRYVLIDRINGAIDTVSPAITTGATLYSFDLTIPVGALKDDVYNVIALIGTPAISPPPAGYAHQIDAADVTSTNSLVLTVIPEPMTIALLGLGGLFLRRRK